MLQMDKGSLSLNLRCTRGGACRAPPALVSVGERVGLGGPKEEMGEHLTWMWGQKITHVLVQWYLRIHAAHKEQ